MKKIKCKAGTLIIDKKTWKAIKKGRYLLPRMSGKSLGVWIPNED